MTFNRLALFMLCIVMFSLLTNVSSQPAFFNINENVEISQGFILEKLKVNSSDPFTYLKFNISGIKNYISIAYVKVNESVIYRGKFEDNLLVFEMPSPQRIIEITILYKSNVFSAINGSLYVSIPLVLSPVGISSNTTVSVSVPTRRLNIINNTINAKVFGDIIRSNLTNVKSGTSKILKVSLDPDSFSLFSISQLNRTIVIEKTDFIKIIDELEITGLSSVKTKEIHLHYPKNIEILGVEGPLGPYVKNGVSSSYRVESRSDKKILSIRLRSPPQNYGDKEYVKIILGLKINSTDTLSIPVFGYDFLIENYSVAVKVRGKAEFRNVNILKEEENGNYHIYYLKTIYPLYNNITSYKIELSFRLLGERTPMFIYMALFTIIILVLLGTLYFAYLKRSAKRIAKAKEEIIEKEREDAYLKIYEYEKTRIQLLETLIETWRAFEDKKISRQTYKQRYSRLLRKESSYSDRVNDLLKAVEERENLEKELDYINENILDFKRLYKMLEKTMTSFNKGLISKREYRRRIDDTLRDLEERIEKLYERIERLREL
ncbi:MAG: hypothetical protein B6U94_03150 [Thermofilum sp. ex4484_79]|nr:MAG: hypothetical protein B6U94_03150 [Thermofilum sp. ex4484_79]